MSYNEAGLVCDLGEDVVNRSLTGLLDCLLHHAFQGMLVCNNLFLT